MRNNHEVIDKIKSLRLSKSINLREVEEVTGVSRSAMSRYESHTREFPMNKIGLFANLLDVSVEYLLGVEMNRNIEISDTISIPLYGSISCGDLTSIDNELLEYIKVPADIEERYGDKLFAVIAKGESMNKKVPDGATAVFAQDAQWENGDIVAVMVNGEEATMKHIHKTNSSIILEPNSYNPSFESTLISCNKVNCNDYVKVLGKLVYMHQKF